MSNALVSIIIPCYNQGRFLSKAIESVLSQSYPDVEIIVVDDGSTDNTKEVAGRYPSVRYIYQHNQKLAQARNTGLQHSRGKYIVFLDCDDFLYPEAIKVNIGYLEKCSYYVLVAGHYQYINENATVTTQVEDHGVREKFYLELLKVNYISSPAVVMYRRRVFDVVGYFNTSPHCYGCEDYEMYCRIARTFPIFCHSQVIAAYRRHSNGLSSNSATMLKSALYVLEQQWHYIQELGPEYHSKYRRGQYSWRNLYGRELVLLIIQNISRCQWNDAYRNLQVLLPHIPVVIAWQIRRLFTTLYFLPELR